MYLVLGQNFRQIFYSTTAQVTLQKVVSGARMFTEYYTRMLTHTQSL